MIVRIISAVLTVLVVIVAGLTAHNMRRAAMPVFNSIEINQSILIDYYGAMITLRADSRPECFIIRDSQIAYIRRGDDYKAATVTHYTESKSSPHAKYNITIEVESGGIRNADELIIASSHNCKGVKRRSEIHLTRRTINGNLDKDIDVKSYSDKGIAI